MTRGMYTAATGMLANQTALDAISQNLANADTTGYKEDIPQFQSFGTSLLHRLSDSGQGPAVGGLGQGVSVASLATDLTGGSLQKTGNSLDVALTGNAALVVQTPQGLRLSQDGALTRSTQGLLVQTDGSTVLGQNGKPITIPAAAKDVTITQDGHIIADGKAIGQLRLAGLTSAATKVGDNQYTTPSLTAPAVGSAVRQGFLETSNVSVVKEMVSMIAVNRAYETNQKMLKAEDDATDKAVNDFAKV